MSNSSWRRPAYSKTYHLDSLGGRYKPLIDSLDRKAAKPPSLSYTVQETEEALKEAKLKLEEMEKTDQPKRKPVWEVHPYYYPVEKEYSRPHDGSEWPESRPHYDLVSSYDVMVGYLGLRPQDREARTPRPSH